MSEYAVQDDRMLTVPYLDSSKMPSPVFLISMREENPRKQEEYLRGLIHEV